MTITIKTEGRRFYLIGNTYPIKDAIKNAGCSWDKDKGAWWTGSKERAESLVAGVAGGSIAAKASFRKLANGDWGVLVPTTVAVGDKVTVSGQYGDKEVTIASVVETTDRGSLCAIVKEERKSRPKLGSTGTAKARGGYRAPRHGGQCRGHGCCAPSAPGCAGYCKQCHFDEYDG